MSSKRWPIHPLPVRGEALSSWLLRVAAEYGLSLEQLIGAELNGASVADHELDFAPPESILKVISVRSGQQQRLLRSMTLSGSVLFSTNTQNEEYSSRGYVANSWFFNSDRKKAAVTSSDWVPWHSPLIWTTIRGCRKCFEEQGLAYYCWYWRLPVLSSCGRHDIALERVYIFKSSMSFLWSESRPTYVSIDVTSMDARTRLALDGGEPTIGDRCVSGDSWMRLLRTIADDLSQPISRSRNPDLLKDLWRLCHLPCRGGVGMYRPFEQLNHSLQRNIVRGVAKAIELFESGKLSVLLQSRFSQYEKLLAPSPSQRCLSFDEVLFEAFSAGLDAPDHVLEAITTSKEPNRAGEPPPRAASELWGYIGYPARDQAGVDASIVRLRAAGVVDANIFDGRGAKSSLTKLSRRFHLWCDLLRENDVVLIPDAQHLVPLRRHLSSFLQLVWRREATVRVLDGKCSALNFSDPRAPLIAQSISAAYKLLASWKSMSVT